MNKYKPSRRQVCQRCIQWYSKFQHFTFFDQKLDIDSHPMFHSLSLVSSVSKILITTIVEDRGFVTLLTVSFVCVNYLMYFDRSVVCIKPEFRKKFHVSLLFYSGRVTFPYRIYFPTKIKIRF